MVKIKQLNSLSFIFLPATPECCITRFLPVMKQYARIIAVKIIINKSNVQLTFEFGNFLDFECIVLRFDASTGRN